MYICIHACVCMYGYRYYDFNTTLWTLVEFPPNAPKPSPRVDMVLMLVGNGTDKILFMHGIFVFIYLSIYHFECMILQ